MQQKTSSSNISSKELKKPKLLLVEGKDDVRFLDAMLKKLNIDNVQTEAYEGTGELLKNLKTLKKRPDFSILTAIGITRDTDKKTVNDIFKTVNESLEMNGFSTPSALACFSDGHSPKTGIFILPDCEKMGELEDMLLAALSDSVIMKCINQFVDCCTSEGQAIKKPAKTRLYAWLAAQDAPHLDLWVAGNRDHFDFDHIAFKKLRQFLKNLSNV